MATMTPTKHDDDAEIGRIRIGAKSPAHLEAVFVRQPQVQEHNLTWPVAKNLQAPADRLRAFTLVTLRLQAARAKFAD